MHSIILVEILQESMMNAIKVIPDNLVAVRELKFILPSIAQQYFFCIKVNYFKQVENYFATFSIN